MVQEIKYIASVNRSKANASIMTEVEIVEGSGEIEIVECGYKSREEILESQNHACHAAN